MKGGDERVGIYLNPGNSMFQRQLDDVFYVDKTGIARFLNERMGTARALVCVSRPRRFGKSVDADMLVAYYTRGADSHAQFEGLALFWLVQRLNRRSGGAAEQLRVLVPEVEPLAYWRSTGVFVERPDKPIVAR